ncbi:NAD(P)-binding protein [Saccharata proteae CBS 121410]|uniref:NAD(P)-binding protein n=1 Tax=Saccharata proteae CBS 121410 TaxID=1314787 RepID=A0A9P4HXL7_9PEZI|nr:NAD(P)-binding protein [Saccharata proteae CBS 121410]
MDFTSTIDPNDLFSAKGLVVAITGGGSGIGLAMTAALYKTGASKVYILGRRLEVLASAASSLNPDPDQTTIVPVQCDITSPGSLSSAVALMSQKSGYVDVLINNAGMSGPSHKPALQARTIEELQAALSNGHADGSFELTFRTNTQSVAAVSTAFLPLLDAANARRGWQPGLIPLSGNRSRDTSTLSFLGFDPANDRRQSQIITTASVAAFNKQLTSGLAYSGSKAAAAHIGKMLAMLLRPWGIRSNVVAPGLYPSDMAGAPDDGLSVEEVPAGRKGAVEDVAGLVLYLVGKGGAYVNGAVLLSDGGRLSGFPSTM